MVLLNVQPGVLSGIFFVILDLFMLNLLDAVLSLLASYNYFEKMKRGNVIRIKSVDMPGLTSYLLDKHSNFSNIMITLFKMGVIIGIFFINLNIKSSIQKVTNMQERSYTFVLNPSDEAWQRQVVYTVRRSPLQSKNCMVQEGEKIKYYQLAYNLEDDVDIQNDLGDLQVNSSGQYQPDANSIICQSPENVTTPALLSNVVGCSRKVNNSCEDDLYVTKNGNLKNESNGEDVWTRLGLVYNFTVFEEGSVKETWSEYTNPQLTCLSSFCGATVKQLGLFTSCLLVERNGTHTIIEKWDLTRDSDGELIFVLGHGGPVFEGDLPMERLQSADYIARHIDDTGADWRTVSSNLMSEAAEFKREEKSLEQFSGLKAVTEVAPWVLVLAGCSFVAALVARLFVAVIVWRNKKSSTIKLAQVNTINGLSEIIQQIYGPDGKKYAIFGIRTNNEDEINVGPFAEENEILQM